MRRRRATLATLVLAALGLALAAGWWRAAQPVAVPDGAAGALPCVSYAPSRGVGEQGRGLTEAQLRHDLALLAQRTRCIRTYTVAEGYDRVPAVAREFGLEVLLGLWIGRDAAHNERELALGTAVARGHRDVVRAVVVGNEVLLRHERTPAELGAMLRRVATATALPVTYADVWGFWLQYPELARDVAFVTVHILPYWDDDPVAVEDVIDHVDRLHARLQRAFPGKPLFVGETGWPSAGRPRGPAVAGPVQQARYLREFTQLARRRGFDFNVIEAFDQAWKIPHEGTVGGHWGLYDARARPKFDWTGPVVAAPLGTRIAVFALVAAALAAVVAACLARAGDRWRQALAAGALASIAATVAAHQWRALVDANVGVLDWGSTLAVAALGWLALLGASRTLLVGAPVARDPVPRHVVLLLLAAAAYVGLGLVFAGRHRDFPVWLFLPGTLALALRALSAPAGRDDGGDQLLLAAWLVVAGLVVPLQEQLQNLRSLAWGLTSLVLGLSVLGPWVRAARERDQTGHDADPGPGEVVEHHAAGADREREQREPLRPAP